MDLITSDSQRKKVSAKRDMAPEKAEEDSMGSLGAESVCP